MEIAQKGELASSRISSKGQITVPAAVRSRLGLREGDRVKFVVENGRTVLLPVRDEVNPFEKWIGVAPAFKSLDEVNDYISDIRGRDPREEEGW